MTYHRTVALHQSIAKQVSELQHTIENMSDTIRRNFQVTHQATQKLNVLRSVLSKLKSALDDDYHELADDDTFKELGNIYYKRH